MSAYKLSELAQMWANEEMTAEQMIGQLLVTATEQEQRVQELEKKLEEISKHRS